MEGSITDAKLPLLPLLNGTPSLQNIITHTFIQKVSNYLWYVLIHAKKNLEQTQN
ncbi:hypothetical protein OsJ_30498 [Oryza sativa Japonica Group]|uniref:Uncharacterized protein n=3 Tax=Oryza TaxID=4527 RepID=A0A8J8YDB4_ORYSJ|nr:hypothetical protein LOC_Os10g02110 [Oryza sativa Japonica Group]EAZ15086.1 hypothetical protein OsJ_30498 [Oryza sativa Japonica Group]